MVLRFLLISSTTVVSFSFLDSSLGGVREFFYALKEHVNLTKSPEDPNIFYISELSEDPSATLRSSLDAERFQTPEVQRNAPHPLPTAPPPVPQPPPQVSQPQVTPPVAQPQTTSNITKSSVRQLLICNVAVR